MMKLLQESYNPLKPYQALIASKFSLINCC